MFGASLRSTQCMVATWNHLGIEQQSHSTAGSCMFSGANAKANFPTGTGVGGEYGCDFAWYRCQAIVTWFREYSWSPPQSLKLYKSQAAHALFLPGLSKIFPMCFSLEEPGRFWLQWQWNLDCKIYETIRVGWKIALECLTVERTRRGSYYTEWSRWEHPEDILILQSAGLLRLIF